MSSRTSLALAALLALPAVALADTYGLPPATGFEKEWRADETACVGSSVVVARTADDWTRFWKKHDPEAAVPSVNFERSMVVGIVREAKDSPLAIYRVELDDAGAPKELLVRAAGPSDAKAPRVHLVQVPRCALAVRFVRDEMVDGAMFGVTGGVDEKPLGSADRLPRAETKWPRAEFREDAEHEAWAALGAEGIAAAKKKLWPGVHGTRYPQLWSKIDVRRKDDTWEITYDGATVVVEVGSGKATRKP